MMKMLACSLRMMTGGSEYGLVVAGEATETSSIDETAAVYAIAAHHPIEALTEMAVTGLAVILM
jgi:hypothetical protein